MEIGITMQSSQQTKTKVINDSQLLSLVHGATDLEKIMKTSREDSQFAGTNSLWYPSMTSYHNKSGVKTNK